MLTEATPVLSKLNHNLPASPSYAVDSTPHGGHPASVQRTPKGQDMNEAPLRLRNSCKCADEVKVHFVFK